MKIILLTIGKTTDRSISQIIDNYVNRLGHYIPFEIKPLPDIRSTRGITEANQKTREGEMILSSVGSGDKVILLDERGKMMTSRDFSAMVSKTMAAGATRNIFFVVGGPYGFSDAVYERADSMLSLSMMTFPHEMVRLFFVEQLYRAMTILRGEPYHHD